VWKIIFHTVENVGVWKRARNGMRYMPRKMIFGGYVVLVTLLSVLPSQLFPPSVGTGLPYADKGIHLVLYAVFAVLLYAVYVERSGGRCLRGGVQAWIVAASAGYATAMEFCQLWFCRGSRTFDWADAVANLAGACLGWAMARWVLWRAAR
jgi:glycopeptide antibiotics resistance protein